MDKLYNSGGFFKRLLMFARLAHDRDWFRQYTQYEARALMLRIYEGQLVPGLLQTPDYARACLVAGRVADVDLLLERRMKRQVLLERANAPAVQVLLDQAVLHRMVGGPAVMKDQLARILELSERPNIIIRVVPWSEGAHPGMDGAFKVIRIKEGEVAFVEAPGGGRLIHEPAEVLEFTVRFDRIGAKALSEDSSRSLLVRVMERLDDPSDLA